MLAIVAVTLVPAGVVGLVRTALRGRTAGRRYLYRRTAVLLMRLGPTFIKAGQVLGTRRDVLPAALCDELSVLQDSVAPLNRAETRRAFAEAYGMRSVEGRFAHLVERPVASGSVASVYQGTLASGGQVAIKLRRPGIDRVMRRISR